MNEAVKTAEPRSRGATKWLSKLFWTCILIVLLIGFVIGLVQSSQLFAIKKQLSTLESRSLELDRRIELEDVYANRLFQIENLLAGALADLQHPGSINSQDTKSEILDRFVAPETDKFLIASRRVWVPDGKHTMIVKTWWDTSDRLDSSLVNFRKPHQLARAFKDSPSKEHRIPLEPNYVYEFEAPELSKSRSIFIERALKRLKPQLAETKKPESKKTIEAEIEKFRRMLKWWNLYSNAPDFKSLESSLPFDIDDSTTCVNIRPLSTNGYMRFPGEIDPGCNLLEPLPKQADVFTLLKWRHEGDKKWMVYITVKIESEAPPCVDLLTGSEMAKRGWEKYLKPVDDSGRYELNLDAIEAAKGSVEKLIVPDSHLRELRAKEYQAN